MTDLIQAYSSYKEFKEDAYFVVCFNTLPSKLWFSTPLEATKEHMEEVLAHLDPERHDLELIFKYWTTEDSSNADFSQDYPYKYLYKSRSRQLLIWVSLEYDRVDVDFYYDQNDQTLENWIVDLNHELRQAFGIGRKPVFKVLSRNKHHFYTEDVRTEEFRVDVSRYYNDDFQEADQVIRRSLVTDKAGLILLHGTPGTGKTTYIKSLITGFEQKNFIFVQNEFVSELLHPDFISFMLKRRNAILIIEDAEKVLISRDQARENSVVSTILQLTDGLFSDFLNIKIICTFNTSISRIDQALLRKGRMIAYYEFKPLCPQKANDLMIDLGLEATDEAKTLADIFNYRDKEFRQEVPRMIGFN